MYGAICNFNSKRQPHKIVQHSQTIRRLLPSNCLSVFDHFVGLAPKGLTKRIVLFPHAIQM